MDLSFRITSDMLAPARELAVLPGDLAALLITVAARQADSSTARIQMILDAPAVVQDRFAPIEGSFNAAVAHALAHWKHDTAGRDR
ncbi:MAG TPA: hypothetical protein VF695_01890 [Sphingomonas sp.]